MTGWGTPFEPSPETNTRGDLARGLDLALHDQATLPTPITQAVWDGLLMEVQILRAQADVGWFENWCERATTWVDRAFPGETMEQLGLAIGEEAAELIDVLALGRRLTKNVGLLQRAILKESHGKLDRRSEIDWVAERRKEFGDVMITLAVIASRDGFNIAELLEERLSAAIERHPEALADGPR